MARRPHVPRLRIRRRDEHGAVALLMAGLMTVIVIVAAMGVDLGNAWQRKVTVQKSVDVSAISAAHLLPKTSSNTDAIYAEVATYLNKASNVVLGQPGTVTAAQLHDGQLPNGEVTFESDTVMKVVAPQAHVDYGLANLVGVDSTEVSAEATVALKTPIQPLGSVLPMWLPAACVYGPLAGDVAAAPVPSASPVYTLNTPKASPGHTTTSVTPASVPYATESPSATIVIHDIPKDRNWAVIRFTFGNTQYVDYLVTFPMTTAKQDRTVTIADLDTNSAHRVPDNSTVTDPTNHWTITSTSGKWEVWPLIPNDTTPAPTGFPLTSTVASKLEFPKNNGQGYFEVTGGGEVACNGHQRGNFGQLDSPRADEARKQWAYARNVAFGLDHELAQFDSEPSQYECPADGTPTGAEIDDDTTSGNNCLYVDPGNDPQGLTDGLLGGGRINEGEGRLQKPTSARCASRGNLVIGGKNYNNDTLSCFLKPGYTLADIASDTSPAEALYPDVLDSPRFFYVPVVWQGDRLLKKYIAIKAFAPVFLTDETIDAVASSTNGLALNPGGKVQYVQIFGFNEVALPILPNADTTDYVPGTNGVVRLVN
jgi:Flp pilus assembly protein TadG